MNYQKLSEEVKDKMYDLHLKETYESPYQEQFRYFIGRDYWIEHNNDKLNKYYKIINKTIRKQKIIKIKSKLDGYKKINQMETNIR